MKLNLLYSSKTQQHLEESRKYLKDIYKGLIKETKTTTQSIDEGREVAQALNEYATQLQLNRESGKFGKGGSNYFVVRVILMKFILSAAALRQSGDFSSQFYELSTTLNAHRVNKVLVPMRDLVRGEIREARVHTKT